LVGILAVVIIIQMALSRSTNKIENYKYQVIQEFGDVQIRSYEPTLFSSVVLNSKNYQDSSSEGFRQLAGYIFGGNQKGQKIAMTSPVAMNFGETTEMMFMIPSEFDQDELPKPNNPNIKIKEVPEKTVAAISFSGWANDRKIEKYKNKLLAQLDELEIDYYGSVSYLGYNPPYEVFNRKNEIIIEIEYPKS
jgi:effector-binding domain-containing protein